MSFPEHFGPPPRPVPPRTMANACPRCMTVEAALPGDIVVCHGCASRLRRTRSGFESLTASDLEHLRSEAPWALAELRLLRRMVRAMHDAAHASGWARRN